MNEICAIVLAAGESTRMKTNKLLLPFHGRPIIAAVIENIADAGVDHILVVLGRFRDDMNPLLGKMTVMVCFNPDYKHGMVTSVQCGFRHLPETAKAALIFLGDQPMIPGAVTRQVIQTYNHAKKGIIIPLHEGKRGHPVLIDRKYAKEIANLEPAESMRVLIARHSEDIQEVETGVPGILRDIDTKDDYRKEIKLK